MNPNSAELVCQEGEKEIPRMLDAGIYLSSTSPVTFGNALIQAYRFALIIEEEYIIR